MSSVTSGPRLARSHVDHEYVPDVPSWPLAAFYAVLLTLAACIVVPVLIVVLSVLVGVL